MKVVNGVLHQEAKEQVVIGARSRTYTFNQNGSPPDVYDTI